MGLSPSFVLLKAKTPHLLPVAEPVEAQAHSESAPPEGHSVSVGWFFARSISGQ